MTRWAILTLGTFIVLGVLGVATARFFGKSGSRLSIQVSVVAHWLAAYVLWSFATGLAQKFEWIAGYEAAWYAPVAIVGGWLDYRLRVAGETERALALFVGVQLVWLLVILYRSGVLTP